MAPAPHAGLALCCCWALALWYSVGSKRAPSDEDTAEGEPRRALLEKVLCVAVPVLLPRARTEGEISRSRGLRELLVGRVKFGDALRPAMPEPERALLSLELLYF